METGFTYEEFTTRNIGFVSEEEQIILKNLRIFVPGVGGMGGTVVACLARVGIENFIIADLDSFEISNLNRQIFSSTLVIGKDKAAVTKRMLEIINPQIKVELYGEMWVNELDNILSKTDIVINGCDDIKSTIQLMRKCKEYKLPAIDAFASPLPNVYVVHQNDKRPEEIFGFPTLNLPFDKITKEIEMLCLKKEVEHIGVHSRSLNYIDLQIAKEIMNGTRKRISFAPMVWTTACMMVYEVIRLSLDKKGGPGIKGMFFNPWTSTIEKPKGWLSSSIRRFFVRRYMRKV